MFAPNNVKVNSRLVDFDKLLLKMAAFGSFRASFYNYEESKKN